MLGAQLRDRQEAAHALVLDQQSAAVRVVRRNLDNFSSIKMSLNFFPAAVFGCFAQTQQTIAVIKLGINHASRYLVANIQLAAETDLAARYVTNSLCTQIY